jgi:hypothetical protein
MTSPAPEPLGFAAPAPALRTGPIPRQRAPQPAVRRRPVPWTGLAWVTWRQHRLLLAGAAALLAALGLYLLIMGLKIHSAYAAVASCHPVDSAHCQQLSDAFNQEYYGSQSGSVASSGLNAQTVPFLLLAVPALLGVFAGAPLLAREFETGTFRFAWTQGAGRARWTVTKLALLAVVLTGATQAFSMLFSWYVQPFLAEGKTSAFPMQLFGTRGVDFAAWTLAAFAIGAFAGAVIRRAVPAMAASLATWLVLNLTTMMSLRQHYEAPVTSTRSALPAGDWLLSGGITGPGGRPVAPGQLFGQLPPSLRNAGNPASVNAWLAQHHYTQWWTYQPASRFWHFQFIEGGWLLALSLVLITATVWMVRRRAA